MLEMFGGLSLKLWGVGGGEEGLETVCGTKVIENNYESKRV